MKIVQVNKFYFPEYGTERYLFGLMDELKRRGHTVIPFAMQHSKNAATPFSKYFVSQINLETLRFNWSSLKAFGRMIYSLEARSKFAQLLDETKPDVVHVHSIHHHISPSILREATKRGIPVVQTLHDYKLVTPAYLFPMRDGKPCINCRRGKWLHVIRHRAHKGSIASTALLSFESFVHATLRIYERHIYKFIAPSRDMAQRLVELGVNPKQLTVIPHYNDLSTWKPAGTVGKGVLFAGRLMADRGIDHVLRAARALPAAQFSIAGDGPERAALEAKLKLQKISNVTLLGRLSGKALQRAFAQARVVFFPTLTLDTFGLTVLEAMASGKPVVATNLGGVNDLVNEGETGYLYDPQNPDKAIESIKKILSDEAVARNLGRRARKAAEEFSLERHYNSITQLYCDALVEQTHRSLERAYGSKPRTQFDQQAATI